MKLMILGLDGLDVTALDGAGRLHSPLPVSGPAWQSIYTGMTAERHGVTSVWGDGPDGRLATEWAGRWFWNRLPVPGTVCNMPIATVGRKPIFVSGFPGPFATLPEALEVCWQERGDLAQMAQPMTIDGWSDSLKKAGFSFCAEKATDDALFLLDWFGNNAKGDLGCLGLTFPDRILHSFYTDEAWLFVCSLAAKIVVMARDIARRLIVVSDHGFERCGTNHTKDGVLWDSDNYKRGGYVGMTHHVAEKIFVIFGFEYADFHSGAKEADELAPNARLTALGYY